MIQITPLFRTLLLGLLALFLSLQILHAQSYTEKLMSFPIRVIWADEAGIQMGQISLPESIKWEAPQTGKVLSLWNSEEPDRNEELGTAYLEGEDMPVLNFRLETSDAVREGDLIEVKVQVPGLGQRSVLTDLVTRQVWLTDVFDQPFYSADKILREDGPSLSSEVLDTMIRDIQFVAGAMREQGMEDTQIEEGTHKGKSIFDMMAVATTAQLQDFFGYVCFRPAKYRGHTWKVSEVYATWLMVGAPTESQLMVSDIFAEIHTKRKEEGDPDCEGEELMLDLKKGTLNGFAPSASLEAIKERFPCYTGETEEGKTYNCGGGVFYLNHGFFFYSHRDYLEVRSNFRGKLSMDLLGKSMEEVSALLGKPKLIPEPEKDEENSLFSYTPDIHHLYKRKFGALRITYDAESKRVVTIGVHHQKLKEIEICW